MNTKTKELPENIKTWVDALDSGNYPQTTGALCNTEGYCCLGVYAKVVLGLSDVDMVGPTLGCGYVVYAEGDEKAYDDIQSRVNHGVYQEGIRMNDAGEAFVDIAKMIREAYV